MKRFRLAVAMMMLTVGVALAQGQTRISNVGSGLVMGFEGAPARGSALVQAARNDYAPQVFVLVKAADGCYHIEHTTTRLYVGVASGSTQAGARLILWTPDGTPNQDWKCEDRGTGYVFVNRGSGLVIGVAGGSPRPGTPLIQWREDGTPNQRWLFR